MRTFTFTLVPRKIFAAGLALIASGVETALFPLALELPFPAAPVVSFGLTVVSIASGLAVYSWLDSKLSKEAPQN